MHTGSNWKNYKKRNIWDTYNLTINFNYLGFFAFFEGEKKNLANDLKREMHKSFLDKVQISLVIMLKYLANLKIY